MKNIITIQHTQSIHHTNGMVGSWTDWDLSELGVEQANKIGEKLKKQLEDMFSDAESRRDEWNRLKPLFDEIMASEDENIIIVSHGDLLSVFNAMFLGLEVESLNQFELFGMAGGVSLLFENNEGKRFVKRMGDLSYIM